MGIIRFIKNLVSPKDTDILIDDDYSEYLVTGIIKDETKVKNKDFKNPTIFEYKGFKYVLESDFGPIESRHITKEHLRLAKEYIDKTPHKDWSSSSVKGFGVDSIFSINEYRKQYRQLTPVGTRDDMFYFSHINYESFVKHTSDHLITLVLL